MTNFFKYSTVRPDIVVSSVSGVFSELLKKEKRKKKNSTNIHTVEVVTTSRKTPHLVFLAFSSAEAIDSI